MISRFTETTILIKPLFQFLYTGVKEKPIEVTKQLEYELEDHSKNFGFGLKRIDLQCANMGVAESYKKQSQSPKTKPKD